MNETHDDVIREKRLPRVGDTVRSRKYGTLWRVIEKREAWQNTSDLNTIVPAIYLCFWRIKEGQLPGFGNMLGYAYTLHDTTFETNWEKVNNS
jgi:solute carrier family 9B (sodium/hydrogen exchanger), member 1/2